MNSVWSRLIISLLACCIGALAFVSCRQATRLSTVASVTALPTPLSTRFEETGVTDDGLTEEYRRPSDDAIVTFYCADQTSEAKALQLVRLESTARLVERTDVVDSSGKKIGERVVWLSPYGAAIEWNEGARFFDIGAESVTKARTFEKSKAWRPGCWDARLWQ